MNSLRLITGCIPKQIAFSVFSSALVASFHEALLIGLLTILYGPNYSIFTG